MIIIRWSNIYLVIFHSWCTTRFNGIRWISEKSTKYPNMALLNTRNWHHQLPDVNRDLSRHVSAGATSRTWISKRRYKLPFLCSENIFFNQLWTSILYYITLVVVVSHYILHIYIYIYYIGLVVVVHRATVYYCQ